MQPFAFSLNTVLPIFLIILLDWWLRYGGMITDEFVTLMSKLVFNVAMPTLLFIKVAELDFTQSINFVPIVYSLAMVMLSFAIVWVIGRKYITTGRDLGVFIQGSYRSNFGIIGFAIAYGLMGDIGLSMAALYLAIIVPFYNVLAIISLTVPLGKEGGLTPLKIMKTIVTNPLIIGILLGLAIAVSGTALPSIVTNTSNYLADMALPMALLGVGGTLRFRDKGYSTMVMAWTCINKLLLIPIIVTGIAILIGFAPIHITTIFILFACPTASASFIMADALGGNRQLAGASVVFSTIFSVITLTLGLMLLLHLGLVPEQLIVDHG